MDLPCEFESNLEQKFSWTVSYKLKFEYIGTVCDHGYLRKRMRKLTSLFTRMKILELVPVCSDSVSCDSPLPIRSLHSKFGVAIRFSIYLCGI